MFLFSRRPEEIVQICFRSDRLEGSMPWGKWMFTLCRIRKCTVLSQLGSSNANPNLPTVISCAVA
eukprot:2855425-Pyramimonas_sp.AAC.1